MEPYYHDQASGITIYCGDGREVLPTMPENSIDTVITDPPYELGFMGKRWDSSGVAFNPETWSAVLRVCKPGAILLAFGGTRTFHRLTCAIEDGGWEIRDCMMWLYGSGFPKSLDISKAIDKAAGAEREIVGRRTDRAATPKHDMRGGNLLNQRNKEPIDLSAITAPATDAAKLWGGWGSALKPAYEPIVVAMKPLDGTFAANAQKWGCAGLNIDGARIGTALMTSGGSIPDIRGNSSNGRGIGGPENEGRNRLVTPSEIKQGRWAANVLLDGAAAELLDEQSGYMKSGASINRNKVEGTHNGNTIYGKNNVVTYDVPAFEEGGGASRFFYTAKASRSDRGASNNHPTVKPTDLMKYLCKITATPTGGTILDPFAGSGSTIVAAREYGRKCVGIEMEEAHCRIIADRLRQQMLFGVA